MITNKAPAVLFFHARRGSLAGLIHHIAYASHQPAELSTKLRSKMETLTSLVRQLILQGQSVPETESHPEG